MNVGNEIDELSIEEKLILLGSNIKNSNLKKEDDFCISPNTKPKRE